MASVPSTPVYIARSPICVNAAGERVGDGVFAGQDFGAGEQVAAIPRPMTASLDTLRLEDTCANCYVWTEGVSIGSRLYVKKGTRVSTCAGCQTFRYCSKACQKESWNRGHKHLCKALRPISDKELPKAVLATMELLIRKKHGLISDQHWEELCRLDSHLGDFKETGQLEGIELMAMGASQFSRTQDTFDREFVAHMYGRVLTNSMTLITPSLDPLGIMIDPLLCRINHSCDPNAYIMMDGPKASIRTLRPIKKDEEIYMAYNTVSNPYARRQTELKSRWFFICKCIKCLKGPSLLEDKWAIESNQLTPKWKEIADGLRGEIADDPANYVGDSEDDKRVALLQAKAFQDYDELGQGGVDVFERIWKLDREGMRMCHETGLWPLYRQPYAALRDELIVQFLAVGNYHAAMDQCTKRYRDIHPKLFQDHHPLVVVQTWQMAMIALYLASERKKEGLESRFDEGRIGLMLAMEVMTKSERSHGEHNAFSKSVKAKVNEMVAQLREVYGHKTDDILRSELPRQKATLMQIADLVKY